jgi:hypothetical protein
VSSDQRRVREEEFPSVQFSGKKDEEKMLRGLKVEEEEGVNIEH